jgi:hypothetical protein
MNPVTIDRVIAARENKIAGLARMQRASGV